MSGTVHFSLHAQCTLDGPLNSSAAPCQNVAPHRLCYPSWEPHRPTQLRARLEGCSELTQTHVFFSSASAFRPSSSNALFSSMRTCVPVHITRRGLNKPRNRLFSSSRAPLGQQPSQLMFEACTYSSKYRSPRSSYFCCKGRPDNGKSPLVWAHQVATLPPHSLAMGNRWHMTTPLL
jgi:hypothetical protein